MENSEIYLEYSSLIRKAADFYQKARKAGIPKQDARYAIPQAVKTDIIMKANMRQLRHMIDLRGGMSAQWEIREIFKQVLRICKDKAPTVFYDMEWCDKTNSLMYGEI
jgi:thymidylate synthase (FAD)